MTLNYVNLGNFDGKILLRLITGSNILKQYFTVLYIQEKETVITCNFCIALYEQEGQSTCLEGEWI